MVSALWWILGLLVSWAAVFLASSPAKFKAYYPGGIWSVVVGVAIEFIIRRNLGWWNLERVFTDTLWVAIATFVGPRFVEGLFFFQQLPKQTSLQLPAAVLWAVLALVADIVTALLGFAHLTAQTASVALLSHMLRFFSLLAIFYGMSYEQRAERLGLIKRQALFNRIGKSLWKLSWAPLYFGMRMLVGAMEKRQR